jgi:hypothetical protein
VNDTTINDVRKSLKRTIAFDRKIEAFLDILQGGNVELEELVREVQDLKENKGT